jgi:hypothetical protein
MKGDERAVHFVDHVITNQPSNLVRSRRFQLLACGRSPRRAVNRRGAGDLGAGRSTSYGLQVLVVFVVRLVRHGPKLCKSLRHSMSELTFPRALASTERCQYAVSRSVKRTLEQFRALFVAQMRLRLADYGGLLVGRPCFGACLAYSPELVWGVRKRK